MTITAQLDKNDLITLIKGSQPTHKAMDVSIINMHVSYSDQYGTYSWHGLEDFSEEQLWYIYSLIKKHK